MSIDSSVDTLEIRNADKIKFIGTSNTIIDTTTGRVGIGMEPTNALDVMGNVYVSSNLQVSNINFTGSFNQNGASFASSPWTTTGDDLSYTTGKVGVGTNSPSGTLHVAPLTSTGHTITASPTSQWGTLLEPEVYDSNFSTYYNNCDITGVANDSSGNVYVVGLYRSDNAYDLGNGVSLPASLVQNSTGYIIKYNSSGTPQWANTFEPPSPGTQFTSGESVATDSNGNVYVTGRWVYYVNFGNSITLTGSGQTDAFIVKFNGSGVAQWAKPISGSSDSYPYGIATDSSGNVYTVGYYSSTTSIDLGNSVTLSASNGSDAFLVKHNTDGVAQWVINIDTSGTCLLKAVTTDSGGNVFVTGGYNSTSDVSLASYVTLPNSSDVTHGFIVKYTSGVAQWVKVINGTTTCAGRNVATDSNGNIYLVGQYSSTSSIDLGNSVSLPVTVSSDAFVVKYNTGGTPQWAKSISGTGNDSSYGIATNSNGDVYVVGDYTSTSDIDIGNNLTLSANSTANTQEGFIIIYDTDGTPQSVRIVSGSSTNVQLRQIKVDSNNNIYVGGAGLVGTNQITIDDNTTLTRSTNASSAMQDVTGLLIKYVTQGTLTDTALTVAGNVEIGTANLFVNTTSGKVGVGTKTPSAKLHIVPDSVIGTDLSSMTSQWGLLLETQWLDYFSYYTVSSNQVEDVAVDSNGNVYVTGWYRSDSTWNVGNSVTLPSRSGTSKQSFTIKYNSTGTPQWGKTTGGSRGEGRSIVTDSSGNVYVTGGFNNSSIIDLGNSVTLPNVGTSQLFTYIVKYDTDGTAQWANAVEATSGSDGYGIAVDSNGNVYVTGRYRQTSGTTSLGNGISLPQTNSDADPCTIKYNSSGVAQWANGIGTEGSSGAGPNYGYGIATDSNGDVYVTGSYYHSGPSAISLGNGVTIPANTSTMDAFIVKYNTTGTAQWANVIDSSQTIGRGIATDSSGNVYVTGIYENHGSSISFGNSVTLPDVTTTPGRYIFTAKYDTNGVTQWANALETSTGTSYSDGYGIATDSNGNVYVTGTYIANSDIDLGNNITLPAMTPGNGYVVVYDTDGTTQGVRVIENANPYQYANSQCAGRGIATGPNDTIIVVGEIPVMNSSVAIDDTVTLQRTTYSYIVIDDNIGFIIKYSAQTLVRDVGLTVTGNVSVVGGEIFSGAVNGAKDQDVTSYLGRVAIGYDGFSTDDATFAHIDNNSSTSFALKQLASGETHINSNDNQQINFRINNVSKGAFSNTGDFFVTSRVGIGTTTPEAELHVLGNTFASPTIPSGNPLWYKTINSPSSSVYVMSVATDPNGNVYTCGHYQSTSAFSIGNGITLPISTQQAAYIVQYDSSGTPQWRNVVDGASFDYGQSVATDSVGNVYFCGHYISSSSFSIGNGLTLPSSAGGGYDVFFIKYSSSGLPLWAKSISGSSSDYGIDVATDPSGNVYLSGRYNSTSTVSLGSGLSLPISSGIDAYIIKYDTSGNPLWFKTINGTSSDYGTSLATDSNGNVYFCGYYYSTSTVSLGSGLSLPISSGYDAFIVKYDNSTSGNPLWFKTINGGSSDYGSNLATDSAGNVYFSGQYFPSTSTISLGNGLSLPANSSTTGRDAFIVKYDSTGNALWSKTLMGSNNIYAEGVATDSDGSVHVYGRYDSTSAISLGNSLSLPIASGVDLYIVKYDSTGNALQYNTIDGTSSSYGYSVATDSNGNVYIGGHYNSTSTVSLGSGLSLPISTGQDGFIIKYNFPTMPVGVFLNGNMGRIGINTTSPGYALDVTGDINFTGSLYQNGTAYGGGGTSYWALSGSNISYTNGDVSIGTSIPDTNFHVVGTSRFDGEVAWYKAGERTSYANYGSNRDWFIRSGSTLGKVVIQDGGGYTGIGTTVPQGTLHVSSGTAGDCRLILQADTDNNNEGDNPRIEFWQDGAIQESAIGMTSNRLNLWNSVGAGAGIAFHTGTVDGWTNAIERMTITSTGSVGINQTSPNYTLDVGGNINFTGNLTQNGVTYGGGGSGSSQWIGTTNIYYNSGNVGIGLTNPTSKLHVDGNIYATGNVTAYSDKRTKTNLQIIDDALNKVSNLNGYTYEKDGTKYTGLVAQEVLEVLPEAVVGNEEDGYALAYGNMVGILVEAIKELSNEVKILKEKLYS